jgi:N-acetylglucosamine kinase-like BadF-type ATPase
MNEMEKYLDAIAAAVDTKDKKAIELLDGFATYVYHKLYAISTNTTGEEHVICDGMLQRAKALIARMAKEGPDIW